MSPITPLHRLTTPITPPTTPFCAVRSTAPSHSVLRDAFDRYRRAAAATLCAAGALMGCCKRCASLRSPMRCMLTTPGAPPRPGRELEIVRAAEAARARRTTAAASERIASLEANAFADRCALAGARAALDAARADVEMASVDPAAELAAEVDSGAAAADAAAGAAAEAAAAADDAALATTDERAHSGARGSG
jgi:hypothetical protein